MNNRVKFDACRNFVAACLAALCLVCVACNGNNNAEEGTSNVSVTTEETAKVEITDSAETALTVETGENEPEVSISATDTEPVIIDKTVDTTDLPKEPEENLTVTDVPKPDITTSVKSVTTDADKTKKPASTSVTTQVTIKVLPDGGIVLPDDEW